jgi:SP family arabinose:H+ symporter-like MFS transporter
MRNRYYIFLISLIAAFGGLLFGFDIAIFSGTIPFIQPYYGLTSAGLGWTGSSLYVGCIIGTFMSGYSTDKLGRKIPLTISAAIFMISSILMGMASSITMLVTWRIIAGVAVGAASMLSPLYIAEISPAANRGKFVSINQLTIVLGILLAYLSNYLLADVENNWRWMFASGAVPSLLFLITVFFVPESPRWLISKGSVDKAHLILVKVLGTAGAATEMAAMQMNKPSNPKGGVRELVHPAVIGLVGIGITLAVFQQISGANAVFFYAPLIFKKAGMNVSNQLFQQVLIGAINLVFTLVAMQLVDKIGRKKLMVAGALLMALWLGAIAVCFQYNIFSGYWLSGFVLLFIATYATTLAPVTWVLISEIFPGNVRGLAMSLATGMLWVACFALAYGFPILIDAVDPANTYFIFGGICLAYFFFLIRFVPETKGKTLEQFEMEVVH